MHATFPLGQTFPLATGRANSAQISARNRASDTVAPGQTGVRDENSPLSLEALPPEPVFVHRVTYPLTSLGYASPAWFIYPGIAQTFATQKGMPLTTVADLATAVDRSRGILELKNDFDGEGSPGYSSVTWKNAIGVLTELWSRAVSEGLGGFAMPRISPGPSGSIDLYWRTEAFTVLVNIPPNTEGGATFYARAAGGTEVEGSLDTESYRTVLEILKTE